MAKVRTARRAEADGVDGSPVLANSLFRRAIRGWAGYTGVGWPAASPDAMTPEAVVDGIVLLKEDHKTVEKLFKQFEKAGEDAHVEKRKIADKVIDELTTHTWIEEKIFYPAAREAAPDTKDHVLESIEEHHVVLWMLSELKDLDAADERFDAKMSVLMENVRHHVEEEEKEWFPEVRKAMGRNRLTELGEQMEAAKNKAPGEPLAVPSAKH
ncbi:hemerythrin domain-containing protein [Streptomyces sp. M-16]|uniref:hemerythrin domain-containing protein n=1 Tax=Streptomyces sp. M-16 TaxID=3233040 RepID=UPI003F9DAF35